MEMRGRSSLVIPFFMALLFHVAGVVCAGCLLIGRASSGFVMPAFQQGESSLELTLLSPDVRVETPTPEVPLPQPEVHIDDPVPAPETMDVVPVSITEPSVLEVKEAPNLDFQAERKGEEVPDLPGESVNADVLKKGVEGGIHPASAIRPVYPLGSRLRGEEGAVVLGVSVDTGGAVLGVTVIESSGYSGLDNAAVKAVKRSQFVTTQVAGGPVVEGEARLTVRFCLTD